MRDEVKDMSEHEKSRRVAEEFLFFVLDHIDEPIVVDIEEAKKSKINGRAIDVDFNIEAGTVTLQVVNVPDESI